MHGRTLLFVPAIALVAVLPACAGADRQTIEVTRQLEVPQTVEVSQEVTRIVEETVEVTRIEQVVVTATATPTVGHAPTPTPTPSSRPSIRTATPSPHVDLGCILPILDCQYDSSIGFQYQCTEYVYIDESGKVQSIAGHWVDSQTDPNVEFQLDPTIECETVIAPDKPTEPLLTPPPSPPPPPPTPNL